MHCVTGHASSPVGAQSTPAVSLVPSLAAAVPSPVGGVSDVVLVAVVVLVVLVVVVLVVDPSVALVEDGSLPSHADDNNTENPRTERRCIGVRIAATSQRVQ
jgi:hypothetical protein